TTPTTRTGPRSDAAIAEYVAAPPMTFSNVPEGISRSSKASDPTMRQGDFFMAAGGQPTDLRRKKPGEPRARGFGDRVRRRHDRALRHAVRVALLRIGEHVREGDERALRRADVLLHRRDDSLDGDVLFALVPAVVVGGECERRERELRFAGELRLRHRRHPD